MSANPFRICLRPVLFVFITALFSLISYQAMANHFRYGTMSYEPVEGEDKTVLIKCQVGWTNNHGHIPSSTAIGAVVTSRVSMNFGDSTSSSVAVRVLSRDTDTNDVQTECVESDGEGGYTTGVTKTYSSNGTYTVYWGSSARESAENLNSSSWRNELTITIGGDNDGNSSPVVATPPIVQVRDNNVFSYQMSASDADGNNLNYRWGQIKEFYTGSDTSEANKPTGLTISSSGLISWDVDDEEVDTDIGDRWQATIMVEDLDSEGEVITKAPVDFVFKIVDGDLQPPPATPVGPNFDASGTQYIQVDDSRTLTYSVTDPDWEEGDDSPAVQAINPPSTDTDVFELTTTSDDDTTDVSIYFAPTEDMRGKSYNVVIQTTDDDGLTSFLTLKLTVAAPPVNNAPTLNVKTAISVDVSGSGTIGQNKLEVTDEEQSAGSLTYTVKSLPSSGTLKKNGVALGLNDTFTQADINSDIVTYTHGGDASPTDSFAYTVSDGQGGALSQSTYSLNINQPNVAPVLSATTLTVTAGATYTGQLAATDQDGDNLTYSVVSNPTKGAFTFNSNGSFTYRAGENASGSDTFVAKANDGQADSSNATITLAINHRPVVTTSSVNMTQGQTNQFRIEAGDADSDSLTYTIVEAPSVGTLTLRNSSQGRFSFVAPASAQGSYTFKVKVNDGTIDSEIKEVTLVIGADGNNLAPTIDAGPTLSGIQNTSVQLRATASDGDGDTLTYTWSQLSGDAVTFSSKTELNPVVTLPSNAPQNIRLQLVASDGTTTSTDTMVLKAIRKKGNSTRGKRITTTRVVRVDGKINGAERDECNSDNCAKVSLGGSSYAYVSSMSSTEVFYDDTYLYIADWQFDNAKGILVALKRSELNGVEIDLVNAPFKTNKAVHAVRIGQGNNYGFTRRIFDADPDGDGDNDFVVLVPGRNFGEIQMISKPDLQTWSVIRGTADNKFKTPLMAVGDVNGREGDEVVAGHLRTNEGSASLSPLLSTSSYEHDIDYAVTSSSTSQVFSGLLSGDNFTDEEEFSDFASAFDVDVDELSVNLLDSGDVNADGLVDLIATASDSCGIIFVFGSEAVGDTTTIMNYDDSTACTSGTAATSLETGEDVTGDGIDDIVIGYPGAGNEEGKIYVIPGRYDWTDFFNSSNPEDYITIISGLSGDQLGNWLVIADNDGDGINEIYTNQGDDGTIQFVVATIGEEPVSLGGSAMGAGGCTLSHSKQPLSATWFIVFAIMSFIGLIRFKNHSVNR